MEKRSQSPIKLISLIKACCILLTFAACSSNDAPAEKETAISYRAIYKSDTATLHGKFTGKAFYGQMEVNYNGAYKDSGEVNGIIKGDSLLGTFHFQHYGIEQWHRIPIALLKKDRKLIMGVGEMEVKMNMTFFKKNVPIDYEHVKFVFEKIPAAN